MPNWVYNELTIRKQDRNKVLNENDNVDFNILCPMPEELKDTISGMRVKDCRAFAYLTDHSRSDFVNSHLFPVYLKKNMSKENMLKAIEENIGKNPQMFGSEMHYEKREDGMYLVDEDYGHTALEIGRYYNDLEAKYGSGNWYDWSVDNWGTKWNASCTEVIENGDMLSITFTTAWDSPDGWLKALSERCPFHIACLEEQGYRWIKHNNMSDGSIATVELPDLNFIEDENGEFIEDEDGNYVLEADEYGEFWREHLRDDPDVRDESVYEKWDRLDKEEMDRREEEREL